MNKDYANHNKLLPINTQIRVKQRNLSSNTVESPKELIVNSLDYKKSPTHNDVCTSPLDLDTLSKMSYIPAPQE